MSTTNNNAAISINKMNESISASMSYAGLPIAALVVSGLFALNRQLSKPRLSMFQHFAAGVVIAAVALELLPVLLKAGSVPGMTVGYLVGVVVMLLIERFSARAGANAPIAIDLFIDGLLLMIGFSTGEKGGFLLLLGLTLETTSLGMVLAPSLAAGGKTRMKVIVALMGFGLSILAGAGCGLFLPHETGFWFAAILGFGVAALLYLVIEELIAEAHETKDTAVTTALFFAGFFIPLLLGQVNH